MKTNEDFEKWFEAEADRIATFIDVMIPEARKEYYLRKAFFAHNDELEAACKRIKTLEKKIDLYQRLNKLSEDRNTICTK